MPVIRSKMPAPQLCQIYIPGNAGSLPARAMYPVGLNGRYEAKLIGITFADQTNAKDNRLIRVRSDSFRKAYGNSSEILFCNRHEHNMGNPQGDFPFYIDTSGGGIDLELTSSTAYNGGANNSFDFCVLSFSVTPLE